MRRIFSTVLYFTIAIWFVSCSSDDDNGTPADGSPDFAIEGLQGKIVRKLVAEGNEIFAVTDQGLFVRNIGNNSTWQAKGLANKHLMSFARIANDYWLASAHDFDGTTESYPLYKSTNQGGTWTAMDNNFGGEGSERINEMYYDTQSQKLYAAGTLVVGVSTDKGATWTPVYGFWGAMGTGLSMLSLQPGQNTIWVGGQNAIEEFILIKYNMTTQEETFYSNLLPAPSVAKKILFDPQNPQRIIVGAEGGIIESKNGGNTWSTLLDRHNDSKFFFGLAFDKASTNTIYAAGWLKNFDTPQELKLYYSTNGGQSWKSKIFGDTNLFGGVWSMVTVEEAGKQVLYLGLLKGGIARIQLNDLATMPSN